jgi:hypothetical protein
MIHFLICYNAVITEEQTVFETNNIDIKTRTKDGSNTKPHALNIKYNSNIKSSPNMHA